MSTASFDAAINRLNVNRAGDQGIAALLNTLQRGLEAASGFMPKDHGQWTTAMAERLGLPEPLTFAPRETAMDSIQALARLLGLPEPLTLAAQKLNFR